MGCDAAGSCLTKIGCRWRCRRSCSASTRPIMLAISMLVITALVGTRDLGQEVYIALAKADVGRGIVAGLGVACIAMIADRLMTASARAHEAEARPWLKRKARAATAMSARRWRQAAALPIWRGPVEPAPLRGGLTNTNFVVEDAGRKYVVRIGGDIEVHGIVRKNELAASRAAHAAGVAPEVVHAEPGVLVLAFIEGRTFTPEDVRNPKQSRPDRRARPAHAIRRSRSICAGPGVLFWVFHVIRDYAHTLAEATGADTAQLRRLLARARASWSARSGRSSSSSATTTCSPPTSSTTASGSGWSTGNMPASTRRSSISAASPRTASCRRRCARRCWKPISSAPVTDELRYRFAAMTAASLLRETMWSMVSEIHSHASTSTIAAYTRGEPRPLRDGLRGLQGDDDADAR